MYQNTLARVAVVGTSGAGKTTFARSLSRALGTPHVELDALYWGPNWTPVPQEEFRARVASAVRAPTWIIDGNYSPVRDLVWRNATSLVWLNYPFTLVFSRALAPRPGASSRAKHSSPTTAKPSTSSTQAGSPGGSSARSGGAAANTHASSKTPPTPTST